MKGLEPTRLAAPDPKSGAYTNSATSACVMVRCKDKHIRQMENGEFKIDNTKIELELIFHFQLSTFNCFLLLPL